MLIYILIQSNVKISSISVENIITAAVEQTCCEALSAGEWTSWSLQTYATRPACYHVSQNGNKHHYVIAILTFRTRNDVYSLNSYSNIVRYLFVVRIHNALTDGAWVFVGGVHNKMSSRHWNRLTANADLLLNLTW